MVERTLSMREAQGSIPWFSTLFVFLSDLGFNACGVLCLGGVFVLSDKPYNRPTTRTKKTKTTSTKGKRSALAGN